MNRNYATYSKLREVEVQRIHREYSSSKQDEFELAEAYGVSLTTIYDILRGRSWKWLELPPIYKKDLTEV